MAEAEAGSHGHGSQSRSRLAVAVTVTASGHTTGHTVGMRGTAAIVDPPGYLQAVGIPAPRRAPISIPPTAALSLPCAASAWQSPAACIMYVLVGSGAIVEFCWSAAQHAARPPPPPPPPFFGGGAGTSADGTAASSGLSCRGAVFATTGCADGSGGGGSSFLQPAATNARRGSQARCGSDGAFIRGSVARPPCR